ncbi:tRNA ligase 1-like [Gossypium hirsutum]|uniref:tRNA ligase 1-like n=1 Tax=Gossypium hirsutum TaxID=3635 RepID=A0ABM3BSP6_GOSHI|nr:tRNA ligase 1-like [Gossypium hirsutum]
MSASRRFLCTLSHSFPHKSTLFPFSRSRYFYTLAMSQKQTKPNPFTSASASVDEAVTSKLGGLSISDGHVWKPKSYGTVTGSNAASAADVQTEKNNVDLSRIFLNPNLLEIFKVDNSTYSLAQIRATFYPKFENEKSDQEIRIRMIEMVSKGLATLEVSLKHSGSLFMYAGNEGGAYAKTALEYHRCQRSLVGGGGFYHLEAAEISAWAPGVLE